MGAAEHGPQLSHQRVLFLFSSHYLPFGPAPEELPGEPCLPPSCGTPRVLHPSPEQGQVLSRPWCLGSFVLRTGSQWLWPQ